MYTPGSSHIHFYMGTSLGDQQHLSCWHKICLALQTADPDQMASSDHDLPCLQFSESVVKSAYD